MPRDEEDQVTLWMNRHPMGINLMARQLMGISNMCHLKYV
jgi:hypothetical protein